MFLLYKIKIHFPRKFLGHHNNSGLLWMMMMMMMIHFKLQEASSYVELFIITNFFRKLKINSKYKYLI
jgi:hypothetical protein